MQLKRYSQSDGPSLLNNGLFYEFRVDCISTLVVDFFPESLHHTFSEAFFHLQILGLEMSHFPVLFIFCLSSRDRQ